MAQGHKQEERGDNEASSEYPETNSASNNDEHGITELAERLELSSVENRGHEASSENAEAQPNTMSQEQIDLARELCRERVPFTAIGQMMGVSEGTVDPFELKQVLMEAELLIADSLSTQGEYVFEKLQAGIRTEKQRREGTRPISLPRRGSEVRGVRSSPLGDSGWGSCYTKQFG